MKFLKVMLYICAVIWAVELIGLLLGNTPSNFTIGCALGISILSALELARTSR